MALCLQSRGSTLVSGAQHGRASHGGEGNNLGAAPRRRTSTESADALGGERRHFFVMPITDHSASVVGHFEIGEASCPPESGGQHDRDSSRDRAGGGSKAASLQGSLRNHPSRDTLRGPAALLTQEGKTPLQFQSDPLPLRLTPS
jgi:hypothetical protein